MRIFVWLIVSVCFWVTSCNKAPLFFFSGDHAMSVHSFYLVMGNQLGDTLYSDILSLKLNGKESDFELECNDCDGKVELRFDRLETETGFHIYEGTGSLHTYRLFLNYANDSIKLDMIHRVSPAGSRYWNMKGKR